MPGVVDVSFTTLKNNALWLFAVFLGRGWGKMAFDVISSPRSVQPPDLLADAIHFPKNGLKHFKICDPSGRRDISEVSVRCQIPAGESMPQLVKTAIADPGSLDHLNPHGHKSRLGEPVSRVVLKRRGQFWREHRTNGDGFLPTSWSTLITTGFLE